MYTVFTKDGYCQYSKFEIINYYNTNNSFKIFFNLNNNNKMKK